MSGQAKEIISSLKFNNYIVKNVIFKYNENFNDEPVKITFNINKQVVCNKDNSAEVTLIVDVFDEDFKKIIRFICILK